MNRSTKTMIFIFSVAALLLCGHLCFLYGVNSERAKRICINPAQMEMLDGTLKTAKAICVDMAQRGIADLKAQLEDQKSQVRFWQKKAAAALASSTEYVY